MNKDEVLRLATLARISVSNDEAEQLSKEFDAILGYVGEVKDISNRDDISSVNEKPAIYNIMREDDNPHTGGIFREAILNNAPSGGDDYIKVKKIL